MKHLLVLLALTLIACGDPADDDMEETPTPSPTPVVVPSPVATPTPRATEPPKPSSTPKPPPVIHPPLVPPAKCSIVPKTSNQGGQFVNNPGNSRGTIKLIWPNRYTDKIVDVTAWGGVNFFEKLDRKDPNEYGDRERFYGNRPLADYPAPLVVGALLTDGNRVCVTLADPKKRVDVRLD